MRIAKIWIESGAILPGRHNGPRTYFAAPVDQSLAAFLSTKRWRPGGERITLVPGV